MAVICITDGCDGKWIFSSHHIWSLIMIAPWLDHFQLTIVCALWPHPSLMWREWCSEAWNAFTECQEFGLFPRLSQPHNERTQKLKVWLKYFDLCLNTTRDANYECFPRNNRKQKMFFPLRCGRHAKWKYYHRQKNGMECNVRIKSEVYESASLFWPPRLWPAGH